MQKAVFDFRQPGLAGLKVADIGIDANQVDSRIKIAGVLIGLLKVSNGFIQAPTFQIDVGRNHIGTVVSRIRFYYLAVNFHRFSVMSLLHQNIGNVIADDRRSGIELIGLAISRQFFI